MSHTPGPWVIRRRMYDYAIDSAVGLICGIHTTKRNNSEADARLIAAAPELLKALQGILPFAEGELACRERSFTPDPSVIQMEYLVEARAAVKVIKAAIAKATGGAL